MKKYLIAVAALGVVCLGLFIVGALRPKPFCSFCSPDGVTCLTVETLKRVPDAWGGEEYVYAVREKDGTRSRRYEIDINGRFGDHLRARVSQDRNWAMFYRQVGPVAGNHCAIFAYVDFGNERVYVFSNVSETERAGDMFGIVDRLPARQVIRGTTIVWEDTIDQVPGR